MPGPFPAPPPKPGKSALGTRLTVKAKDKSYQGQNKKTLTKRLASVVYANVPKRSNLCTLS